MAIYLIDKIKPANNGNFPIVDATDVAMPDGSRLSDQYSVEIVDELPDDAADHLRRFYIILEQNNSKTPPTDGGDSP